MEVKIPRERGQFLSVHHAVTTGNIKMLELFLLNKVPPNVFCNTIDKATPLHFAVVTK